ncbi:MAG: glutamine amidotransferase, partial [Pseudomonadota bacterium]
NRIAILVDESRSMALREQALGPTRTERASSILASSTATFEEWRKEHDVDFYTFSDQVVPSSLDHLVTQPEPRGSSTFLAEALDGIRQRYAAADLGGIVIISDGIPTGRLADRQPHTQANDQTNDQANDHEHGAAVRVHTVWAGRPGLRDLAIATTNADDFAFVRTVVKIDAVVQSAGFAPTTRTVFLERNNAILGQRTVDLGGSVEEATVTFEVVPETVGKHVYEISIPADKAETVLTNNTRRVIIRSIRDKARVLLLAGRPSWDQQALRAWLKANPNVDLISFFILRTWDDVQIASQGELSLIPFPTTELFEEEIGSFDAVILLNFEHGPYRISPYLESIRAFVENGGGLVMVGGDLAFSSGRYANTPLAEALPVELLPADLASPELVSTDEFKARLTNEGKNNPITRLRFDRRDNEACWRSLPSLEGLNLTAGAAPAAATILAAHPSLRTSTGQPMPVIAAREYGSGRSLAILTDSMWRWRFAAAGKPGESTHIYGQFWENALRWVIHDPEFAYLSVEAGQSYYSPGALPKVRFRLVDKDYQPARRAQIETTLTDTAQVAKPLRHEQLTTDDSGMAELTLTSPPPGSYRVVGQARLGDRTVDGEDFFVVRSDGSELENPSAREDVLRTLSEASGGHYLGQATSLPSSLPFAPPRIVRVDRRTSIELWSRPAVLLLALGLVALEWAIRRRRGLE